MFGSSILDTAIGMIFVFLIISLLCGIVQELIATILGWRAAFLKAGVTQLLADPNFTGLAKQVYQHPLIASLAKPGQTPSYIPSRTFTLALLDVMDPEGATKVAGANVQELVSKIADPAIKRIANALVSGTQATIEDLRKSVEDWFDDVMDRVSGWYKRRAQLVTLIVGVVVCIGFNVDAVAIFSTLWRDHTLREAIVAQASSFASAHAPAAQGEAAGAGNDQPSVTALEGELDKLALPIGWDLSGKTATTEPKPSSQVAMIWTSRIIGWLIAALATMMGSGFWFDLLNKLLNLRSAGAKPLTAVEQRQAEATPST